MYLGLTTMGRNMSLSSLQRALSQAAAVGLSGSASAAPDCEALITAELMVHPGYPSRPQEGGCGEGPDDFSQSEDRRHELNVLTQPSLLALYRQHRVQLCSFKDLQILESKYDKSPSAEAESDVIPQLK